MFTGHGTLLKIAHCLYRPAVIAYAIQLEIVNESEPLIQLQDENYWMM